MFFDEARDAEGRSRREIYDREFAQKHLDAAKGNARADAAKVRSAALSRRAEAR